MFYAILGTVIILMIAVPIIGLRVFFASKSDKAIRAKYAVQQRAKMFL